MHLNVPDEDLSYEEDLLSFMPILGGVYASEDAFDLLALFTASTTLPRISFFDKRSAECATRT